MPPMMTGSSFGACLRIRASSAKMSDRRSSSTAAMYAAGVFTFSCPFIFIASSEALTYELLVEHRRAPLRLGERGDIPRRALLVGRPGIDRIELELSIRARPVLRPEALRLAEVHELAVLRRRRQPPRAPVLRIELAR